MGIEEGQDGDTLQGWCEEVSWEPLSRGAIDYVFKKKVLKSCVVSWGGVPFPMEEGLVTGTSVPYAVSCPPHK